MRIAAGILGFASATSAMFIAMLATLSADAGMSAKEFARHLPGTWPDMEPNTSAIPDTGAMAPSMETIAVVFTTLSAMLLPVEHGRLHGTEAYRLDRIPGLRPDNVPHRTDPVREHGAPRERTCMRIGTVCAESGKTETCTAAKQLRSDRTEVPDTKRPTGAQTRNLKHLRRGAARRGRSGSAQQRCQSAGRKPPKRAGRKHSAGQWNGSRADTDPGATNEDVRDCGAGRARHAEADGGRLAERNRN